MTTFTHAFHRPEKKAAGHRPGGVLPAPAFEDNRSEAAVQRNVRDWANSDAITRLPIQQKNAGTASGQVIQRYEPNEDEEGEDFLVQFPKEKIWITGTLVAVIKDVGWEFEFEDRDNEIIANHRRIKKIGEEEEKGKKGKKRSYFDSQTTYTVCQHPGCGAEFENKDQLYDHVRMNHPFPNETSYPYLLFGGQSALTHVLRKNRKEGQEDPKFQGVSKATGGGYHSEWNAGKEVPKKKQKGSGHPEFSATTSVPGFMSKGDDAPESLFLTGEPHCGICSNTLPKAGLPLGYPTNARPSQSQGYNIPKSTPNINQVFKDFSGGGKNPDYNTTDYQGFGKDKFPSCLDTAPGHNDKLLKQHAKKGGEQYLKFMTQSMALNKDRIDNFFEKLGSQEKSRDDLKRQMAQYPIPENPNTFMPYCPSPLWKPNEESEDDQQYEENRQKILLERMILSIAQSFEKIQKKGELEIEQSEVDDIDPVAVNNCLITAMNGGQSASLENVGLIRFIIREQVGTPFGNYLQARPEVIFTIAKALGLIGKHVRIYRAGEEDENGEYDLELSQVFIIQNDGTVIEVEGDEVDQYPEPSNGYIDIEHLGGNHFEAL